MSFKLSSSHLTQSIQFGATFGNWALTQLQCWEPLKKCREEAQTNLFQYLDEITISCSLPSPRFCLFSPHPNCNTVGNFSRQQQTWVKWIQMQLLSPPLHGAAGRGRISSLFLMDDWSREGGRGSGARVLWLRVTPTAEDVFVKAKRSLVGVCGPGWPVSAWGRDIFP